MSFWVALPSARGSEPAGRRPAVVLQHERFNRTNLATVVVVAITSASHLGSAARRWVKTSSRSECGTVNLSNLRTLALRHGVLSKAATIRSARRGASHHGARG